jgi:NADH-quinone oxidoreductase E subunit
MNMEKELKQLIERLAGKFPERESAILPALCYLRSRDGYVSKEGMKSVAVILNMPEARVFSVASFYSMLNLAPEGKYIIQICANVVCTLLAENPMFEYISDSLGIRAGEITSDGLFSMKEVECIGACGYAPAMMINEDRYENLTFEKVNGIIDAIRDREARGAE